MRCLMEFTPRPPILYGKTFMKRASCSWLVLVSSAFVLFALPQMKIAENAGLADNAFAGGNDPRIASLAQDSSTAICYASPHGNDLADGLTLRTAKQDVMSCYDDISGGTIFLLDGGHGVPLRACAQRDPPSCGIWIMGSADPNYAHPPAGWRKEKAISFVGGMGTAGGAFSHDYQTNIAAGGPDSKHPGIWLSSTYQITFENLSITSCLPAMVGADSSSNPANGQAWDNVFDNVGLYALRSVGCGPGMFIGSSSSRNFIRHSQIRGSALEQALVSMISRQSNIVTFRAAAKLPSSWKTGTVVGVVGVSDPSFDGGDFTITVTGHNTFTYPQAGPNATSSSGRAASDGNQSIVINPHGAKGNTLYADDLSLYDGAIKVYAGTSGTTLDVAKLDQDPGFGPSVWIATCTSPTIVYNRDTTAADGGKSGILAAVRSDCPRGTEELADSIQGSNPSVDAPATIMGGESPQRKTENPTSSDQHGVSKGQPLKQVKASAAQGGGSPLRTTASPPSTSQHAGSKGQPTEKTKAFSVQVGTFRDPANADHLKALIGGAMGRW